MKQTDVYQLLIKTGEDKSPQRDIAAREKIVKRISALGVEAVEPLTQGLEHPNVMVRVHSAMLLSEIKDARAVQPLIKALDDDLPLVLTFAIKGLIANNANEAVEPLRRLITRIEATNPESRQAGFESFSKDAARALLDIRAIKDAKSALEKLTSA